MSSFMEKVLEWNGVPIRYVESGKGRPVVVFSARDDALSGDIMAALATHHRVLVFDVPTASVGTWQGFATHLTQTLARLDVSSFSVIGLPQGALPALAQAIWTPTQVQRLVLISPPPTAMQSPELGAKLRDVAAPTLVLVGTRDRSGSRETGHTLREQIAACHLLLVYDAGPTVLADRREACLASIGEFLEQGEGFIVFHESQLIHP